MIRENKRWTDEELDELERRYPYEPCSVIAASFGRTLHAVKLQASKLGVTDCYGGEGYHQRQKLFRAWEAKHCFGPVCHG